MSMPMDRVPMDFERTVAAFLEVAGPRDIDSDLVDGALLEARGLPQRRSRIRFTGTAPWPPSAPWFRLDAGVLPATWLAVALLALLTVMATVVVGSGLLESRPSPSQAPALVVALTPEPVPASAAPAVTPGPFASGEVGVGAPCPAMLQLLQTYVVDAGGDGSPPRELGNGDLLYTSSAQADLWVERLRREGNRLVAEDFPGPDNVVFPSLVPPTPTGRIVPSPDGTELAIEAGDLGQAGCGDPIVVHAEGGRTRPFTATAFQLISDLAWAPDGSALYAVRRPTADGAGKPYWDPDIARPIAGPDTVLRWDVATDDVAELATGCGPCRSLVVSPDGQRLAAWGDGQVWVFEDGAWRAFATLEINFPTDNPILLGWVDDSSVVTMDRRIVGVDGTKVAAWPEPCCQGTGYPSVLSPDRTTLAGVTGGSNFDERSVTLLDLRTGETRNIWTTPSYLDCSELFADEQRACQVTPAPSADPMALSGYAFVAAWSPDGTAVLVAQPFLDSTRMRLWVVPTDGSGPGPGLDVQVPDLSGRYGFPNQGSGLAWLPMP
jgi:hypothetical protein